MKIIHKLTLGFLIVALLIWIVGYIAINKSQKALRESIITSSQQIATEVLGKIDRTIYYRIEVFKEYSKDTILQDTLSESNRVFDGLDNMHGHINNNDRIRISVPNGEVTPNSLSEELEEKIEFYEQAYGYKLFTDAMVTNKYGVNVAQTGKITDYRHDNKDWWQKTKRDGLYVEDISYDKNAGIYSIGIGIKLDDEEGNFIGVIKIVLNVEEVIDILNELDTHALNRKQTTLKYKLITREGNIIYSTEDSDYFGKLTDEYVPHLVVNEQHSIYNYLLKAKPGEKEKLFIHAHSGGYRIFSGLGWTLIMAHETEDIFSPVTKLRNRILLISLAITMLAVLMGLLISTSIAKSVIKLKNAALDIGRGNLEVSIKRESNDEIGQLAAAFNNMTDELRKTTRDLKERNSNMSMRYKISSTISRTIDIDELLSAILKTISEVYILNVEQKGGIFIIKGDRMELVSHLGHDKGFLNLHRDMKIGDCLCGLAAKTGEIVISRNCDRDSRHTITPPGMLSHGHIIIPFHARGAVIGVIYLYVQADIDITEDELTLLHSIANQIGIAVDNARLYQETKMDSLHDPLTGLANRRLMDIVLESNFARAKRLNQVFSIIMLDIDHFKKYNDTHGHSAGDKLLIELARLIQKEIREVDLAVRYGGEEFLVVLSETGTIEASEVAERIRKAVEKEAEITISLGVSSFHEGMHKKEELINEADSVLYQVKNKGRNRVEVTV